MAIIEKIKKELSPQKSLPKILFPEGEDERIIEAAKILKGEKIAEPILIGKKIGRAHV